jgi:hypothetical protein
MAASANRFVIRAKGGYFEKQFDRFRTGTAKTNFLMA